MKTTVIKAGTYDREIGVVAGERLADASENLLKFLSNVEPPSENATYPVLLAYETELLNLTERVAEAIEEFRR
jgi:hypothetical protein